MTFDTKTGLSIYEELRKMIDDIDDYRKALNILEGSRDQSHSVRKIDSVHKSSINDYNKLRLTKYVYERSTVKTASLIFDEITTCKNKIEQYEKTISKLDDEDYNGRAVDLLRTSLHNQQQILKTLSNTKYKEYHHESDWEEM